MWVQAILSRDDLVALVAQFTPVTILLGAEEGKLHLGAASNVTIVSGVGLRVSCAATLHWPVLGVAVPVALNSLVVVFRPEISKAPAGDKLVFRLELEHINVAGMPDVVDDHITGRVTKELDERQVELSWGFAKALSHVFPLPPLLEPLDAFELSVVWGEVKVTDDAVVLAVSFQSAVTRR